MKPDEKAFSFRAAGASRRLLVLTALLLAAGGCGDGSGGNSGTTGHCKDYCQAAMAKKCSFEYANCSKTTIADCSALCSSLDGLTSVSGCGALESKFQQCFSTAKLCDPYATCSKQLDDFGACIDAYCIRNPNGTGCHEYKIQVCL